MDNSIIKPKELAKKSGGSSIASAHLSLGRICSFVTHCSYNGGDSRTWNVVVDWLGLKILLDHTHHNFICIAFIFFLVSYHYQALYLGPSFVGDSYDLSLFLSHIVFYEYQL